MNSKKLYVSWVIVALLFLIPGKADAFFIASTFDSDFDGWTANRPSEVSWQSSGGNPGGYLRHVDDSALPTDIFAPSKFLGDWSSAKDIGSISFDHRIFQTGVLNAILPYEIGISGGANSAILNFTPATGATDWVTLTAPLTESEWSVTGSWDDLLSSVDQLRIKMEYVSSVGSSFDINGIDNIVLNGNVGNAAVPEPATMSLLSLGLVGLGMICKKKETSKNV